MPEASLLLFGNFKESLEELHMTLQSQVLSLIPQLHFSTGARLQSRSRAWVPWALCPGAARAPGQHRQSWSRFGCRGGPCLMQFWVQRKPLSDEFLCTEKAPCLLFWVQRKPLSDAFLGAEEAPCLSHSNTVLCLEPK